LEGGAVGVFLDAEKVLFGVEDAIDLLGVGLVIVLGGFLWVGRMGPVVFFA
jgi:hypothetical protein